MAASEPSHPPRSGAAFARTARSTSCFKEGGGVSMQSSPRAAMTPPSFSYSAFRSGLCSRTRRRRTDSSGVAIPSSSALMSSFSSRSLSFMSG